MGKFRTPSKERPPPLFMHPAPHDVDNVCESQFTIENDQHHGNNIFESPIGTTFLEARESKYETALIQASANLVVVFVCLLIYANYLMIQPYITPILFAVLASIALRRPHYSLEKRIRNWLNNAIEADGFETVAEDNPNPDLDYMMSPRPPLSAVPEIPADPWFVRIADWMGVARITGLKTVQSPSMSSSYMLFLPLLRLSVIYILYATIAQYFLTVYDPEQRVDH